MTNAFEIIGGTPLKGEITPQGAKNEALLILSAVLLTSQKITVSNIPDIKDVNKLIELLGDMGVIVEQLAPDTYSFEAKNIDLDFFLSDAFKEKGGFVLDTTHANITYTNKGVAASELYIKTPQSIVQNTVSIKYDDIKQLTRMPQNSSVDIKLVNSVIAINDVYTILPFVKQFMDPKKFTNNIVKLNTTIDGTLQRLNIPLLQMAAFDGTVVNAKAILYNVTDINNLGYDITIFNSSIPKSDLLKFLPGSKDAMAKLPPVINISTNIKGNLNNTTGSFNISSNTFTLNANGVVKNLKNPKALQYDVALKDSRVDKNFIIAVLPPNTLPQSIELPQTIIVNGTAKGDMNNIQPNLKLSGSYGIVAVKGYIRNFKNSDAALYDLQFATSDFAVGKLIKQDSIIGNVTLTGSAKGKGFDYKTMQSSIKADVQSAGFNNYNYQNASISAELDHGNINSTGNINDPNVRMNYTAVANVAGVYPSNVEATVIVDTVQLQQLNLYKDSLNAKFKLYVKAPNTDPDNLDVYAYTDTSKININNKHYTLDSIIATAVTSNGVNNLSLRSPFADVKANGKFEYDKIGQSISQYIDKYYKIGNAPAQSLPAQQISFEGTIKKHPLVTDLVTGLSYENITFKGAYASQGGGSTAHLSGAQLEIRAGIKMVHVPYRGAAPALNDLIAGHIDMFFDTLTTSVPLHQADKIRIMAVAGDERTPTLPDIPTIAESGLPGFRSITWFAMVGPPALPAALAARINRDVVDILRRPAVSAKLRDLRLDPMIGTPADAARFFAEETDLWSKVIREANVTVQ